MGAERAFELFQLAVLACLAVLGVGRGVALARRGVRVIAIDRERPLLDALKDLVFVLAFLLWGYEIVATAWPLGVHAVPAALRGRVVDAPALQALGALVALAGLGVYAAALHAFGASWRLGIDRDAPGPLVTTGIFGWSRNPIYLALDLLAIAAFLLLGRPIFALLAAGFAVYFHDLIRREERFLAERYGDAYREYCARVGRYGSGVRRGGAG